MECAMKAPPDRRTVLKLTGAAVLAVAARPAVASTNMNGTITFEGGKPIPEGILAITLEDPAATDEPLRQVAETRIDSDGKSTSIAFALTPPASLTASAALQIVARLERADGWLLARGSAPFDPASPVTVALNTVMY
jgi:uncharacterized lipoprotein YbaY